MTDILDNLANTLQCGDMGVIVGDGSLSQFTNDFTFPTNLVVAPGTHYQLTMDPLLLNDQRLVVDTDIELGAQQYLVVIIKYLQGYPDGLKFRITVRNYYLKDSLYLVYQDHTGALQRPVCFALPDDPHAGSTVNDGEACEFVLLRDNPTDPTRYKWHKMIQRISRIDI